MLKVILQEGLLSINSKSTISHFDVPGHADYLKNLITGAMDVMGAILVVSITDGIMSQATAQIKLASAVGVSSIIVFINKADLFDDDEREDILGFVQDEIVDLLEANGFDTDPDRFVIGSAKLAQVMNQISVALQSVN